MSGIIEMFNSGQYTSWEDAERNGGVYNSVVHGDITPTLLDDITEAICNAFDMLDLVEGSTRVTTRIREPAPDGFHEFYKSYVRCFGNVSRYDAIRAITLPDRDANAQIRDAWFLWNEARNPTQNP